MKIAFPPSEEFGLQKVMLSDSFSKSGKIGIVDTQTQQITVFTKDEIGGDLSRVLLENEVTAIIAPNMAFMALKVFREKSIHVYKARSYSLKANIDLLKLNCLPLYTQVSAIKNDCSSGCSSCSTDTCKTPN
jgi:predicted Fe-Mo cluster-binding NifX family protein